MTIKPIRKINLSLDEAISGLMALEKGVNTIPKTEAVYVGMTAEYNSKGQYEVSQGNDGNTLMVHSMSPDADIICLVDYQHSAGFGAHVYWASQDAQGFESRSISYLEADRYFKRSLKVEEFMKMSYSQAREWLEANKGGRIPRVQHGRKYAERVLKALFDSELKYSDETFDDLENLFDKISEVFKCEKSQKSTHPDWCYRQITWRLNLPIQLIGYDLSKVKKSGSKPDDRGDYCCWVNLDLKRSREGAITVGWKK